MLSALLAEKYSPQEGTALEFHFYSAEEGEFSAVRLASRGLTRSHPLAGGMLGSGEVSRKYQSDGKKVRSMFHMRVVS